MPAYLKDNAAYQTAALAPAHAIAAPLPGPATLLGMLARSYNSVGGLIDVLGASLNIDPAAVLAVWHVESGNLPYIAGAPVLRFENHKFFQNWGDDHVALFDAHFQFGGHAGIPGASYTNHKFRALATDPWAPFHGTQKGEYKVFDFAQTLANKEAACMSASFGGTQIMGFNHNSCGYATASALFDAFGADLRCQVLGFFDFCQSNGLFDKIRQLKWESFGARYNGNGAVYGPKLAEAYAQKAALMALPRT